MTPGLFGSFACVFVLSLLPRITPYLSTLDSSCSLACFRPPLWHNLGQVSFCHSVIPDEGNKERQPARESSTNCSTATVKMDTTSVSKFSARRGPAREVTRKTDTSLPLPTQDQRPFPFLELPFDIVVYLIKNHLHQHEAILLTLTCKGLYKSHGKLALKSSTFCHKKMEEEEEQDWSKFGASSNTARERYKLLQTLDKDGAGSDSFYFCAKPTRYVSGRLAWRGELWSILFGQRAVRRFAHLHSMPARHPLQTKWPVTSRRSRCDCELPPGWDWSGHDDGIHRQHRCRNAFTLDGPEGEYTVEFGHVRTVAVAYIERMGDLFGDEETGYGDIMAVGGYDDDKASIGGQLQPDGRRGSEWRERRRAFVNQEEDGAVCLQSKLTFEGRLGTVWDTVEDMSRLRLFWTELFGPLSCFGRGSLYSLCPHVRIGEVAGLQDAVHRLCELLIESRRHASDLTTRCTLCETKSKISIRGVLGPIVRTSAGKIHSENSRLLGLRVVVTFLSTSKLGHGGMMDGDVAWDKFVAVDSGKKNG